MTPAANSDGRRRAVLLGAAARLDHDLFQLSVDLCCGKSFVREGPVSREDPVIGGNPGGELRQDVPLSPLRHHNAGRAELG